ncbi:hypothetical protein Tco_1437051 [Tanacetum coccineum]
MSSIPQGPAPAKIVKWQIIKIGKRGAYQIIREDNTNVVYVNFQGLLNDLTRDNLKELYRLMMLKYGYNRPEKEFERILNWRYFYSCSVHCLTMEAAHIYMLTEVKYPLPPRVCKAMLEKNLLEIEKDELLSYKRLPQGLEAAETLAEALSQIKTKRRNVKTGVRRRLDAEDVSTGFEDVSTGFEDVSTGFTDIKSASEKVSSGGEHVSASQREGKAVLEETPQTKRTKKQIREEQASLAEIARIQAEEEAENARREELKRQDELAAKRLQEELELSEAQKKRMAQVQEAAQFYTEED